MRIIIIDEDQNVCDNLRNFLKKKGQEPLSFTNPNKAVEYIESNEIQLVFTENNFDNTNANEILRQIKETNNQTQIVVTTTRPDAKTAVTLMKLGAFDYIAKPILPEDILSIIDRLTKTSAPKTQLERTQQLQKTKQQTPLPQQQQQQQQTKKYATGKSKEARKFQDQIKLVAPTNYSVIIYGESGTGKESVAQTIHQQSPRRDQPFIAVDCGALTKELASSELFGHEKGSFTGAIISKTGQFELANGGTIFLDEITNLSYDIQISLLRVIQERKIKKLGSQKETPIDIRIIVASNEKITRAIEEGKFRQDLYHRINEFEIDLPPLRERNEDILTFAEFFLNNANEDLNKQIKGFNNDAKQVLLKYNWTGNLREMNNVIKRAALLTANKEEITADNLPQEIVFQTRFASTSNANKKTNTSNLNNSPELKDSKTEAEYKKIIETLRKVNYNKSKAALLLNIDRKTLYQKVKSFNIMESNKA